MRRLDLGTVGVSLNVTADDTYLRDAAEMERLGYSAIWIPGGQLGTLDPITKIVGATTAIPVGSAIISPDVHPAAAVTRLHADLHATDPDRLVVGLGGSQTPRALTALHTYLDRLDDADPSVPVDRRILAALGPRKLALARDRCAGAIALLVTPRYTRAARRILGPDPSLIIDQMVVLDPDAARARETARGPLRFLSGVAGYAANFARMGFGSADIAGLSDRLVDELVVWGDADTIVDRVREHLAAGGDHVVLAVLSEGDQPDPIEVARDLAGKLAV